MQADTGKMIHLGKRTKSRIVSKTSLLAGAERITAALCRCTLRRRNQRNIRGAIADQV
jgi:hypothetical protein